MELPYFVNQTTQVLIISSLIISSQILCGYYSRGPQLEDDINFIKFRTTGKI